jgi:hypothetical protein
MHQHMNYHAQKLEGKVAFIEYWHDQPQNLVNHDIF